MRTTEAEIEDWFRTNLETVRATGTRYVLATMAGSVEILSDVQTAPPSTWPAARRCAGPPFATVALTSNPPPRAADRLLDAPSAQRSDHNGRGAFPVRWSPGRIWTARYADGPFAVREGNRLVVSFTDTTEARRWTDRILRELLIHGGRRYGFRLCHGAALELGDGGLLITGESGAGKTDLALKLARALAAPIATVDRGTMGYHHGRLCIGTLPFGMNIHHATLTDLDCTAPELATRYPPIAGKHYLTPQDAELWCGITRTPWTRITCVVQVVRSTTRTRWRPLSSEETSDAAATADTSATDPGYQTDWLGLSPRTPPPPPAFDGLNAGWSLHYRPDHPLPQEWLTDLKRVILPATPS
ncbi:hypothetical protein [Streptomyces sp. NPDC102360]|uniref:hypothetical protein n=1 Tax=Streptomyces sp. NPDC102360 TaxID=3366160 RepID=UPI0038032E93